MKYSTPELVVLGPAASLVMGSEPGKDDSIDRDNLEVDRGLEIGLDD